MSSSYEPFLIAPIKNGLDLGMEPWLTPQDAFRVLTNAYLRRGVLQKRLGYSSKWRFVHSVTDEAVGALGATQYSGTLAEAPLRIGDLSFTDGTQLIEDDGDGTLSGDGTGTINYTTGAYAIEFTGVTGAPVTASYDFYPGNAIVGMDNYYKTDGTVQFLVFDTRRLNIYDAVAGKLEDATGTDEFTGASDDFFWGEIIKDVYYFTNGVDRIQKWDGTTLSAPTMDFDGGGSNDVTTAKLVFDYKERMVLLHPTESSTAFPQRARWSKPVSAGAALDFTNDEYADAPTVDWIVSAEFLGDDLIVFFERSIWRLKYTADATAPFRWELIALTDGSYSQFSTFSFSDEIISVGPTAMIATDGISSYSINKKIPDAVLDMDQSKFQNIFSIVIEENDLVLVSYPTVGAASSDRCLVLNYEDNSWAYFDLAMNVFGYHEATEDPTLDTVEETWDELERAWDERSSQAGFPVTLAGDTSGYVWELFKGGSDNGADIALEIESGQWNPYTKSGQAARLGYLDILVDRDQDVSFLVSFYVGNNPTAYLTETVVCDSENNNEEKVWKRVFCGEAGSFHKIKISHTESNQTLKIHAIMPWFKPAGRLHA